MSFVVRPAESFTFRQEVYFDDYLYGSTTGIVNGVIVIQRAADQLYFDGTSFVPTYTEIPTINNGTSHEYTFTFPNTEDIFYNIMLKVNNDPITESRFVAVTRVAGGDGGGGVSGERVFDAVGFVTGFVSTVG